MDLGIVPLARLWLQFTLQHDLAGLRDEQGWAEVPSNEYAGWALGCEEFL